MQLKVGRPVFGYIEYTPLKVMEAFKAVSFGLLKEV